MMKKLTKLLSFAFVVIFAGIVLAGCTPSNIDKAKLKMEEAGYKVSAYQQAENSDGYVGAFMAVKVGLTTGVNGMVAILFETANDANKFANTWSGAEFSENNMIEGKWVYCGTEEAIAAFTK